MLEPFVNPCLPGSVTDLPDFRVLERFERQNRVHLDFDYTRLLPSFHGGIPRLSYFKTSAGATRRIGRFLTFLDEHSLLTGPPRPTRDDAREFDERVYDLGIPYITDCDPNFFFSANRLVPFAVLFTPHPLRGLIDPDDLKSSLHNCDLPILDTVCFDRSTSPNPVIVCDGAVARDITAECEFDPNATIDYDRFTQPVAGSFAHFIAMLSATPPDSGPSLAQRSDTA